MKKVRCLTKSNEKISQRFYGERKKRYFDVFIKSYNCVFKIVNTIN